MEKPTHPNMKLQSTARNAHIQVALCRTAHDAARRNTTLVVRRPRTVPCKYQIESIEPAAGGGILTGDVVVRRRVAVGRVLAGALVTVATLRTGEPGGGDGEESDRGEETHLQFEPGEELLKITKDMVPLIRPAR